MTEIKDLGGDCRLVHLSKPGVSTGIVPTAAAAAAALMSNKSL